MNYLNRFSQKESNVEKLPYSFTLSTTDRAKHYEAIEQEAYAKIEKQLNGAVNGTRKEVKNVFFPKM